MGLRGETRRQHRAADLAVKCAQRLQASTGIPSRNLAGCHCSARWPQRCPLHMSITCKCVLQVSTCQQKR